MQHSTNTIGLPAGQASTSTKIRVSVILGNPRFADCSAHGICHIDAADARTRTCNCMHQANGVLALSQSGRLIMRLEMPSMRAETIDKYFQTEFFLVSFPYKLPDPISSVLKPQADAAVIWPGEYPYEITDNEIVIYFGLQIG